MKLSFRFYILLTVVWVTMSHAGPQWTRDPSALGNATLDGGLALSIPLVVPGAAPEFVLSLTMVHALSKTNAKPSETWTRRNYMRGLAKLPPLPPLKPLAKGEQEKAEKVTRSSWSIPQLTSYVYPANRDMIIWRPPGGGEGSIFRREDMGIT